MNERYQKPEIQDKHQGFRVGDLVHIPLTDGTVDKARIDSFKEIGGEVVATLTIMNKPNVHPQIAVTTLRRLQETH